MFYSMSTGGFYSPEIHGDNIPADAVGITEQKHAALMAGQSAGQRIVADADGFPVLAEQPAATPEQVQATFVAAIQKRLDTFAQTRGYDGILSACTYATSSIPRFASEGQTCVDLRDATWSAGYAILAAVQAGGDVPSVEQVMEDLPVLAWPME